MNIGPRSFLIVLDVSGSMLGDRIETAKASINKTLDAIAAEIAYNKQVIDIGVIAFSNISTQIVRDEATFQDIADIRAFVDALAPAGNTSYIKAGQDITAYFTATVAKPLVRRSYVFISDGEPTVGTAQDGADELADVLDQDTGIFNLTDGTEINGYGTGIGDASNFAAIRAMYNSDCPTTPVVNDTGVGELDIILNGVAFSASAEDLDVSDQTQAWLLSTNWRRQVSEEIAFRTEILTSSDGTEQRIAQREQPRIKHKVTSFANAVGMRQAATRLAENQARFMYLPSPRRSTFLVEEAAFGQSVMYVDFRELWMVPGRRMILDFGDIREMVTIADICDTRIVIAATFLHTFGAGAKVYRAVPGQFTRQVEVTARTSRAGEIPVEFDADPVFNYHENIEPAKVLYDGKELLSHDPNWRSAVAARFQQPSVDLDLQRGPTDRYTVIDYTVRTSRFLATIRDEETFQEVYGFFYRHKGRWKSFYAPMHLNEILPIGGVSAAGTTMTISGREHFDTFENSETYGDVLIVAEGVENKIYRVSDVDLDVVENTVLTFTEAFPEDINLSAFKRISWVALHRFASDVMTVNWRTSEVGELTLSMQTVRV